MDTELDFALETCEAVMDVWQPGPGREIILNLPCTVERSTPNVYADQIEWMSPQPVPARARLPLRPHAQRPRHRRRRRRAGRAGRRGPGRGLPVRQRRAHRQRLPRHPRPEPVQPGHRPDDRLLATSTRSAAPSSTCNQLPVHPRHPYAGELVYTAFSGSHQDAIKKGFEALEAEAERRASRSASTTWDVPYLPIDPHDVGRSYEAVIRVNSQSGKGGVAYVMKTGHSLDLPRRLQIEFSKVHPGPHRRRGRRGHPGRDLGRVQRRVPGRRPGGAARPPVLVGRRRQAHARRRGLGRRRRRRRWRAPATARSPRSAPRWPRSASTSASSTTPSTPSPRAPTPRPPPTSRSRSAARSCGASASTPTPRPPRMRAILSAVNRSRRARFSSERALSAFPRTPGNVAPRVGSRNMALTAGVPHRSPLALLTARAR